MTDNEIEKYFLSLYKKLLNVKYDLKITQKEFKALNSVNALINLKNAEIDDLKRDTIPKLQEGLKRANKYGVETDKENEQLKAEIERLKGEVEEKTETIDFLKNQAVGWSIDFCNLKAKLKTAKSEARKEFAELVKLEFYREFDELIPSIMAERIDNLLEEMESKS